MLKSAGCYRQALVRLSEIANENGWFRDALEVNARVWRERGGEIPDAIEKVLALSRIREMLGPERAQYMNEVSDCEALKVLDLFTAWTRSSFGEEQIKIILRGVGNDGEESEILNAALTGPGLCALSTVDKTD